MKEHDTTYGHYCEVCDGKWQCPSCMGGKHLNPANSRCPPHNGDTWQPVTQETYTNNGYRWRYLEDDFTRFVRKTRKGAGLG